MAGNWCFTFSSACLITLDTNYPLPSILSSLFSLAPLFLIDFTTDHPPMDRIKPPPVKSGLFPSAIPFTINGIQTYRQQKDIWGKSAMQRQCGELTTFMGNRTCGRIRVLTSIRLFQRACSNVKH
jgi:hypothetical protein